MAIIAGHGVTVGVVQGTTWGTAKTVTKKLRCQSLTVTDNKQVLLSRQHDNSYTSSSLKLGRRNVTVSITCDMCFGGEWLILAASMLGTAAVGAEITGGQADYQHTLDFAAAHSRFLCMAFEAEDDVVCEIPSLKITGVTIAGSDNERGTVTITGIGDRIIVAATTNSNAVLNALTISQTEEAAVFNGTNAYCRMDDYSTSASLASADDLAMTSFSLALQRPCTPYWGLRGANTQFSYEPYQSALSSGTLTLTLAAIDDAVSSFYTEYIASTVQMLEIFVDGSQIGTGSMNAFKLQMPYAILSAVAGFGVGGQATLQQPQATFTLGAPPAAPSGMTGVTTLCRIGSLDKRSTVYIT